MRHMVSTITNGGAQSVAAWVDRWLTPSPQQAKVEKAHKSGPTNKENPLSKELPVRSEIEIFSDLEALCKQDGFSHAIAALCFRDNFFGIKKEITGKQIADRRSFERLIRTEISTLIGCLAKHPISIELPEPAILQAMCDDAERLLNEIHGAMIADAYKDFSKDINPLMTGEAIREAVFYATESAYSFQYRDFSPTRYKNDDAWISEKFGFNSQEASILLRTILDFQSEKAMIHLESLRSVSPDKWTMLPAFMFTLDEMVEHSKLSGAVVKCFLDAFSTESSGGNSAFVDINSFNETNVKPIIETNGSYLLFQFVSLAEAVYEAPFFWMLQDATYRNTASTNRGAFTEQFTFDAMRRIFGDDHVFQNIDLYDGKSKVGEVDVLVSYGEYALVCQAKSQKLTLEARRGNLPKIQDDFQKAIQKAYDQSVDCGSAILSGKVELRDSTGTPLLIPRPQHIFPITVLSDHFPALSVQARQFLKLKSTKQVHNPLCTDVFTLDVISELMPSPIRALAYLERRSNYYERIMTTNELGLFGYFLKVNLWLDNDTDLLNLDDSLSADVDAAMLVRREGLPGKSTPEGLLTKYQGSFIYGIVDEIERDPNALCVELGLTLLEFSGDAIENIGTLVRRMCADTKRTGKQHDLTLPIENRSSGLTFHCNFLPTNHARQQLRDHMRKRKYSQKATSWIGLVLEPGTAKVRFGEYVRAPHVFDYALEGIVASAPPLTKTQDILRSPFAKRSVGRNSPCPCGSGKKHKRCCGMN